MTRNLRVTRRRRPPDRPPLAAVATHASIVYTDLSSGKPLEVTRPYPSSPPRPPPPFLPPPPPVPLHRPAGRCPNLSTIGAAIVKWFIN